MRRAAVLAVLVVAVAAAAAWATIHPSPGTYMGSDNYYHGHRTVTFTYHPPNVVHFKLDGVQILDRGHVSNGQLSTSQNGVHILMRWTSSHGVTGQISYKHSEVHFDAHQFATK